MSMFYELMMRKKTEIMYATIKGSLTENDGVFSGFSASNYLEVQGLYDCSKSFEVVLKIKTGVSNASGFLRMSNDGYGLFSALVGVTQNIGVWSRNTDNIYIANAVYGSDNSVPNNTDKFVKFVFTGTQYIIALSDDGIVWNTTNTINNSTNIGNRVTIKIGATSGTQYFNGSIDLNNSYIKLGSTKYKLQAVVGYTVVGSPTITDGVVSGFSGSDYLMTSSNYTTNNMNNDDYEFGIKLTPTSSMSSECYAIKYYNNSTVRGIGIHNNKFIWSVGQPNTTGHQVSIVSSFNVTTNTTYWLKGIYKNKIASLYYSLDGTNYTLIESIDETDQTFKITSAFNFGATAGSSYGLFLGSIDMKETYIKINNKLWFNGQQA